MMIQHIPDVFVIGAMKAGTTSMHEVILNHRDIQRTNQKECNILLTAREPAQMADLYRQQFSGKERSGLRCDISPMYSNRDVYPDVAKRMAFLNPAARIIYVTRDPIERINSHLTHNFLRGRFKQHEVDEEVTRNSEYISQSKYYYQIQRYLDYFPTSQILVLTLEDIRSNPRMPAQQLANFLGIDDIIVPSEIITNESERRFQIMYYDQVRNLLGDNFGFGLYKYFWYLMNIRVSRQIPSASVSERIHDILYEDIKTFCEDFNLQGRWKGFE